ncbi:MAG: hypothetical protein OEY91_14295 [Nitrospirota bacterium]|nr:hypothetical protein [Nitrospirota bacterium]
MKQGLSRLGLATHPDKTWVGKSNQVFDFLGYHLKREGVTVAKTTVTRCVTRIRRLDEQNSRRPCGGDGCWVYVSRWWRWAKGGLTLLRRIASTLRPPIAC